MSESGLRKAVKEALYRGFELSWVESHSTAQGIPDLFIQSDSSAFWLELKFVPAGEKVVKIRPAQYSWFRRNVGAGGFPMMLVEIEDEEGYFLVQGNRVYEPTCLRTASEVMDRAVCFVTDIKSLIPIFLEPDSTKRTEED